MIDTCYIECPECRTPVGVPMGIVGMLSTGELRHLVVRCPVCRSDHHLTREAAQRICCDYAERTHEGERNA